jgi:MYXO-CTERM domain-containing protein
MAFDRIIKSVSNSARLMVLAPLALATVAMTAPAPAQAAAVGVQTCTVVLFVEVCTGGSASPAPAPMLGGSLLSLVALGGFVALRRRAAMKASNDSLGQPTIED